MELRHHLPIMHDRAGDELGEEQDEQTVVLQRERIDTPRVDVDQECDLLEGDERDPQRQDDLGEKEVGSRMHRSPPSR